MSDAYQAWRETREHLKQEPDSTFLQRVEESLRPAALLAFLGSFRGMNSFEEPMGCEPDEAELFLAELDDLRQPPYRPDETQAEMQRQVSEALIAMRKLPWTGDHLYGDALDDASLVLWAVLGGKKMPVLERFQCPSLYQAKKAPLPVRCERQLPHEGKHAVANVGEWTDEQSANPPKSYDEPEELCGAIKNPRPGVTYRCDKSKGHGGQHADIAHEKAWNVERCRSILADKQCAFADEHAGMHRAGTVVWANRVADGTLANPDPINRPPVELTGEQLDDLATEVFGDGECGAVNPDLEPNPLRKGKSICVRAKAHGGLHRDADGIRWEK